MRQARGFWHHDRVPNRGIIENCCGTARSTTGFRAACCASPSSRLEAPGMATRRRSSPTSAQGSPRTGGASRTARWHAGGGRSGESAPAGSTWTSGPRCSRVLLREPLVLRPPEAPVPDVVHVLQGQDAYPGEDQPPHGHRDAVEPPHPTWYQGDRKQSSDLEHQAAVSGVAEARPPLLLWTLADDTNWPGIVLSQNDHSPGRPSRMRSPCPY